MKRRARLAYAALLLALLLPQLGLWDRTAPASQRQEAAESPLPGTRADEPDRAPVPVPETVRLLDGGERIELPMQDYLVGVLAGEMPVSFAPAALRAQAVAARTYTLYCASGPKHPGADLCSDPGCCQAWLGEEQLRRDWGEAYEERIRILRAAVEDTAGEYLCYEGEPVFAAFHASSAGATEDCGAVWNPRPYLISVPSPESAAEVPHYVSRLVCAPLDFRDTLLSAHPEADLSGEPESWLGPLEEDESGRVAICTLGGLRLRGTEIRKLFGLRSTAFTLTLEDEGFCFTVTGSGHGVGMSQYGAEVMARNGADYREILAHYYPGTLLVR